MMFMAIIFINIGIIVENIIQDLYTRLVSFNKRHPIAQISWGRVILVWLYLVKKNDLFFIFTNQYGNCFLTIFNAVIGASIAVLLIIKLYNFLISKKNYRIVKSVLSFGKNSIFLFPVHLTVLSMVTLLMKVNGMNAVSWYIAFVITMIRSYLIVYILDEIKHITTK